MKIKKMEKDYYKQVSDLYLEIFGFKIPSRKKPFARLASLYGENVLLDVLKWLAKKKKENGLKKVSKNPYNPYNLIYHTCAVWKRNQENPEWK